MIVVDVNLNKKIGSSPDAIFTSFISLEICDNLSEQDHINHCNQNRSSLAWSWCITKVNGMTRSREMSLSCMSVEEKHPVGDMISHSEGLEYSDVAGFSCQLHP